MRTRRPRLLIAAALTAIVLAGCSAPGEAPEPTTPGEPEPSSPVEPTPTEPEPSTDPDDPAEWVIGLNGIGPIVIGEEFADTLEDLPDEWEEQTQCVKLAHWNAPDSSYSVHFSSATADEPAPIELVAVSTPADAVEAVGPVTDEGLGIGATKDEVQSAYPDAEEGEASIGDGSSWMKVPFEGETAMFFQYIPDASEAFAVVVTTLDEPPYEPCA